jgi:hypothetical protein
MLRCPLAFVFCTIFLTNLAWSAAATTQTEIPLPEHPRPDFQRDLWMNLNGSWQFRFDANDAGVKQQWWDEAVEFPVAITVPFSWGCELSGVKDEADIGWYRRSITVPKTWQGERIFVVVGASDWHTTVWLDGQEIGKHQGGYTPFSFELTSKIRFGEEQQLVCRVDDTAHPFKLEGKQGYGRAAGIWQTVYLECRGRSALDKVHFTPDVDGQRVIVNAAWDTPAPENTTLILEFKPQARKESLLRIPVETGSQELEHQISLDHPRLWSLDDPYLYEVTVSLEGENWNDTVSTYFGMRKISVGHLPGTEYPYILLNDRPIYLQLALDQAYHPQGFYTFPSDDFMRDEILRSRQIGLNGQRIHIKVEMPRKLYWADRLGMLIMADVPNSWGEPKEDMRRETEYALRQMIHRDFNHPSIFSWVDFNETWGLKTGREGEYLPETQEWVESIYHLTKKLDPTRLVEDNSPCNLDHVATDLNSWHIYLPGYAWREELDKICRNTFPGSTWNFIGDRKQGTQPMLNSECGNVWGYTGSAGDVDWSWDYHIMMNEFRRHPKICGWLYTEHHDVINEWNGYWRYDRSKKFTGIPQLFPGMSLNDLHSEFYIASERSLCRHVKPGETISVPLYASFMTDRQIGDALSLEMQLEGWNRFGQHRVYWHNVSQVDYQPWMSGDLPDVELPMPDNAGLAILTLALRAATGAVLHRNFTTYVIGDGNSPRKEDVELGGKQATVVRFAPNSFREAEWSLKQWSVLDGLKVNGAGFGHFEFAVPWPEGLSCDAIETGCLKLEVSAKQLFGKDREDTDERDGDFMRGKGTHDPSSNPNAYPMTDETTFPSAVKVSCMGHSAGVFELPDDSADHRGILSWDSQPQDRRLREAGSFGYLIEACIPKPALQRAQQEKVLVLRLEVDQSLPHGLAIYGERFGRFPLDPTLIFVLKDQP